MYELKPCKQSSTFIGLKVVARSNLGQRMTEVERWTRRTGHLTAMATVQQTHRYVPVTFSYIHHLLISIIDKPTV